MDWIALIQTFGGFVAGGGLSLFAVKAYRRKSMAEADSAKAEADAKEWHLEEERIQSLHNAIMANNETINKLTADISGHLARNRELNDRLYHAEEEANRVNNRLTEEQARTADLEKRLGEANRLCDHYRDWHCRKGDCADRLPPNPKLAGRRYCLPGNGEETDKPTET